MKPEGTIWRHARAKADLHHKEAAAALQIAPKTLINIESNQPRANVSLHLVYRAAKLYGLPAATLVKDPVEGLSEAGTDEGVPDTPPKQPTRSKAPPKRQEKASPKRVTDKAVA